MVLKLLIRLGQIMNFMIGNIILLICVQVLEVGNTPIRLVLEYGTSIYTDFSCQCMEVQICDDSKH